jgi:hypothetical protein
MKSSIRNRPESSPGRVRVRTASSSQLWQYMGREEFHTCANQLTQMEKPSCPICRTAIQQTNKVFHS